MSQIKPIPTNYCVYVLRSSVKSNAQPYIGSTPNPPRRLKQHNGLVQGGARRTSQDKLRPWEMVAIVSGFPSLIGALKFEWALNNPHLSLHIPKDERLSISTARKRSGMPKRPRATIATILANVHLLLRVPSFARWPLTLNIFKPDVFKIWEQCCKKAAAPLRPSLPIKTDFSATPAALMDESVPEEEGDEALSDDDDIGKSTPKAGIYSIPVDYKPLQSYVEKTSEMFEFERQGKCTFCRGTMKTGEGMYAVCPHTDCEMAGHLDCWGRRGSTGKEPGDREALIPIKVKCPGCKETADWGLMMKELSLRVRAPKEVEKLLKKRNRERAKMKKAEKAEAAKAEKAEKVVAAKLFKADKAKFTKKGKSK